MSDMTLHFIHEACLKDSSAVPSYDYVHVIE